MLEQEAKKRLATVRLRVPSDASVPLVVDLLFASSGIEPELVAAATEEDLPGIGLVPVASRGHLIALKVLSRKDSGRPNDVLDLSSLICRQTRAVSQTRARRSNSSRSAASTATAILQALLAKALAEFAAH